MLNRRNDHPYIRFGTIVNNSKTIMVDIWLTNDVNATIGHS